MGYLLLGHGGFTPDPNLMPPGMEIVGIPRGTTIQFYVEAGQRLSFEPDDLRACWQMAKAPWPPLDHQNVTYNLVLSNAFEKWSEKFKKTTTCDGYTLIRAGIEAADPILLCTGTPETCPTRPEEVEEGKTHTCDGILGQYNGEMHWLSCVELEGISEQENDAVRAAKGGVYKVALLGGDHPEWMPRAGWAPDPDTITQANRSILDTFPDEHETDWEFGGDVFLVGGPSHRVREVSTYVRNASDYEAGKCIVSSAGGRIGGGLIKIKTLYSDSEARIIEAAVVKSTGFDMAFYDISSPGSGWIHADGTQLIDYPILDYQDEWYEWDSAAQSTAIDGGEPHGANIDVSAKLGEWAGYFRSHMADQTLKFPLIWQMDDEVWNAMTATEDYADIIQQGEKEMAEAIGFLDCFKRQDMESACAIWDALDDISREALMRFYLASDWSILEAHRDKVDVLKGWLIGNREEWVTGSLACEYMVYSG
ncbi:putative adhesin [Streptomyces sp. NPDC057910]|uniref:putative adhesin n=1 Tax=Streptomyces sp. NPDC057910 TaxID=3346278 RepID=UPI0036E4B04F